MSTQFASSHSLEINEFEYVDAQSASSLGTSHVFVIPHSFEETTSDEVPVLLWDWPTRVFHWSLVVAFSVAVITAKLGGDWMALHGLAGISIVGLLVFRIVWGFIGAKPSRFSSFIPTPSSIRSYFSGKWQGIGHNPLGALSVLGLLTLLALQVGGGLFTDDEISFTGPWAHVISNELSVRLTGLHHQLSNILLGLVALHVLAIAFYAFVKKRNLVKPMITGWHRAPFDQVSVAHVRQGLEEERSSKPGLRFVLALSLALIAVGLAGGQQWLPNKAASTVEARDEAQTSVPLSTADTSNREKAVESTTPPSAANGW